MGHLRGTWQFLAEVDDFKGLLFFASGFFRGACPGFCIRTSYQVS
jgi:hypothetical protein